MKRLASTLLAAALGIGLTGQANAGPDRHWRNDHRPQISHHHHYHAPPPRARKHHHHRNDWVGPATVLTIGGLAIGTALYHANTPPRVVHGAPPPPGGNWFYCRSSGQYYPYTQACPEGWQAVRPH